MGSRTYAPHNASYSFRPASQKSIDFLVRLSKERTPHVEEPIIREWAATMGQQAVSAKIKELKMLPVVQRAESPSQQPEVPSGRYAVEGDDNVLRFYKVDVKTEGRWAGYTFVSVQASDNYHPIRSREARREILERIVAAGIKEAMLRYGQELGECGHCGRTLTNEDSRRDGIGPICAGKMGW